MSFFEQFLDGLLQKLSRHLEQEDVAVSQEYPLEQREYPLNKSRICVGLRAVKDNLSGGYWGEDENGEIYTGTAEIRIRLDILTPLRLGAGAGHRLLSKLADFFVLSGGVYHTEELTASGVSVDKRQEAFCLPAEITVITAVHYRRDEEGVFTDVVIRRRT